MELRQLKYFVSIVDMGSLSRASLSLHIAQPALSQQLSRLEDELGVKLLDRSVRGVSPTGAGRAFYDQAVLILKQIDNAKVCVTQADAGPAGRVVIGLPWTISNLLGLDLLQEVRQSFPGIQLEIMEGPSSLLSGLLSSGKLDLAILFDDSSNSGLAVTPLFSEPLLLIGPPGSFEQRQSLPLSEVARLPLLLLSPPNGIRRKIDLRFSEAGLHPIIVGDINAPRLLERAIAKGLGYSVLPASGIEDWIRDAQLDSTEIAGEPLERTVLLSTSRLFPLTTAAECVTKAVHRLVAAAAHRKRWRGRLLNDAPQHKSPL
ncbi:LysR substrate-binding domain-containing protein [Kerstersia gyiorum]|uniref:LysR substrate-binding domain-containing protein n=1 Tax=Kerstersia gyiorum TaxID=206506 RepID=UPI0020A0811B|nr:LysR substrate-binding domain-containing protein [Kerstersia gyiorum]MCP1632906.1 DNA-binding transcriptional LysR family regulator [Kerstersia gyiorum]MCP1635562.1 DNA-binding transcriptional LysR family regulator [Kerstersia gyiorum]MCP1671032.1 DNA-binding transcriptional LysR family regulator [Kerstersia gyiorum]MCP1678313.1 DNA-binding transcriptional LysR family regulator [Kerstersia gyiorum]MCP1682113.1 DNA-binding transcriptional LysR family regulator [Kerstersia gyiorum]